MKTMSFRVISTNESGDGIVSRYTVTE